MAKAKKEPNTELATRAANTMQIATDLQAIITAIVEAGGECDSEQLAALQGWNAALEVKAENIGHVDLRLEMDCEYYKAVEEAARAKREAIEKAQEKLRKYLRDCPVTAGKCKDEPFRGQLFTFSVNKGKASVNFSDKNKLPSDLCEIEEIIKPKTSEILTRLQAGEEINGAQLIFGEKYLTIRKAGTKANE